jgi:hypothetical protein
MRGEVKVDVYGEENCDEHRKYWNLYCEGDMESQNTVEDVVLTLSSFPAGARISIRVPICPRCEEGEDTCDCGFDWKQWTEEEYS